MKAKLLKELRKIATIKQDGDYVVVFFLDSDKKIKSHYSFLTNQYMAISDAVKVAFDKTKQIPSSYAVDILRYIDASLDRRNAIRLLYRMNHPEKYPKTDITK